MKISGVYFIKNKVTQKIYVGSSIDIYRRWARHKDDLLKNKHHSVKLQNSYNKHGIQQFEFFLAESAFTSKQLQKIEQKWIEKFNSFHNGYNSAPFANEVWLMPKTKEHKRKIGNAHKGRKLSEESKEKIRQKALNRKHKPMSEETKKKISKANKGKIRTTEMKNHLSLLKTGVKTGRKLSESHKQALLAGRLNK